MVVAGGVLSIGVAIGETILQFKGVQCEKFCTWFTKNSGTCLTCCCKALYRCPQDATPKKHSECANVSGYWLPVLIEYGIVGLNWVIVVSFKFKKIEHLIFTGVITLVYFWGPCAVCKYFSEPTLSKKVFIGLFHVISTVIAIGTAYYFSTDDSIAYLFPPGALISWLLVIVKIWTDCVFFVKAK